MKRIKLFIYKLLHTCFPFLHKRKEKLEVFQREQEKRACDVPSAALEEYCQQFVASIEHLEQQWKAGSYDLQNALNAQDIDIVGIVGEEIVEGYQKLLFFQHQSHEKFRAQFIQHFLDYPKNIFSHEKQYYQIIPKKRRIQGELQIHGGYFRVDGEELYLNKRQIVKAAFWKIGFSFQEQAFAEMLRQDLIVHMKKYFASCLRGLQKLEKEMRPEYLGKEYNFDKAGVYFEQLMIDVLNEKRYTTCKAPLSEDFLEKTDLRFKIPQLKRRKGARIQVTHTIHPEYHMDKVSHIRHSNEFVILSPLSLAQGIIEKGENLLEYIDYESFWKTVGRVPTVEELATKIRDICFAAIDRMNHDPRGPAVFVPIPIRRLIQKYVEIEACRATRELRMREAKSKNSVRH